MTAEFITGLLVGVWITGSAFIIYNLARHLADLQKEVDNLYEEGK